MCYDHLFDASQYLINKTVRTETVHTVHIRTVAAILKFGKQLTMNQLPLWHMFYVKTEPGYVI